ncbi:MAG: hypothetical protein OEV66_07360 [Spirochaetia bacterium]|nr:hypothetical protein [Spirochaetia bacterium]
MNLCKKIFLLLIFILVFIILNCLWTKKNGFGIGCEGLTPVVTINFSKLQMYENSNFIYTSDMASANIVLGGCTNIIDMGFDNPAGISVQLEWNSSKTSFQSATILLSNPANNYPATIDGTLDTFTQIVGGPYKLVPLRCSTSIPVILNFSQLQIYQNAALSYTQATSTLTANEECGIVYLKNFDAASPVTNVVLYWDSGHTAIVDAWIYDTGSQIQSTITAPASPVTPDTFTNVLGGTYQLVPVRP